MKMKKVIRHNQWDCEVSFTLALTPALFPREGENPSPPIRVANVPCHSFAPRRESPVDGGFQMDARITHDARLRFPLPGGARQGKGGRFHYHLGLILAVAMLSVFAGSARAESGAEKSIAVSPAKAGESSSQKLADAVKRAAQQAKQTSKPVTVQLRGGTYFLDEPLVLRPEHSGIVLAASRGEKPILSGGRRITGWKESALKE